MTAETPQNGERKPRIPEYLPVDEESIIDPPPGECRQMQQPGGRVPGGDRAAGLKPPTILQKRIIRRKWRDVASRAGDRSLRSSTLWPSAVVPRQGCWRRSSWPNPAATCRYIARSKSTACATPKPAALPVAGRVVARASV